jgi:hypothetical protein
MKPKIDLSCGDYFGIILPYATGFVFTNQVGGHACNHPELEGLFIPLDDGEERPTREAFQQHFHGSWATLTNEEATMIDGALLKGNLGFITVDRTRLPDSVEAWVHVLLDWERTRFLTDFDSKINQGILTWENSD